MTPLPALCSFGARSTGGFGGLVELTFVPCQMDILKVQHGPLVMVDSVLEYVSEFILDSAMKLTS